VTGSSICLTELIKEKFSWALGSLAANFIVKYRSNLGESSGVWNSKSSSASKNSSSSSLAMYNINYSERTQNEFQAPMVYLGLSVVRY